VLDTAHPENCPAPAPRRHQSQTARHPPLRSQDARTGTGLTLRLPEGIRGVKDIDRLTGDIRGGGIVDDVPVPRDPGLGQIENEGVQAPELVDGHGFHSPGALPEQAADLGGTGRPRRHLI
jgi:hypothetical protein